MILKIIEKKEQNVAGSVDIKLWSAPSLKREYEILVDGKMKIEYAFCLNSYLYKKFESNETKYKILKQILDENKIKIFHGGVENYFEELNVWINEDF
jgi:hypothetical protein